MKNILNSKKIIMTIIILSKVFIRKMNSIPEDVVEHIISFSCDKRGYNTIDYYQRIKNNEDRIFYIEEGTVEFINNHLLILTTKVIDVAELKDTTIHKSIESAEEQLKKDEISDKEKYLLFYKIDSLKSLKK